jgi:Domain of unknown function (DUF4037)
MVRDTIKKARKTPRFIPGLRLSERFYGEAVRPILTSNFPTMRYSAGLIGSGSEVLGFDTAQSTDHHWGPRMQVFLSEHDHAERVERVDQVLSQQLPRLFRGYSTNFGPPDKIGVRLPRHITSGPVHHLVEITTVMRFFKSYLGVNPDEELQVLDWLTIPEQRLLSVTTGRIYHDGLRRLHQLRERFSYFPRDVWLYLLGAQWTRIAEEEAFIGRAGDVGDELGSSIIATRLVWALMKLCFLMERRYAPYSKWFGTAFGRLACSQELSPIFREVIRAQSWHEREKHLSKAYSLVAEMHNALRITKPLDAKVSSFFSRPYQVIHSERFANKIRRAINDKEVLKIKVSIGSIDQFIDRADIMSEPQLFRKMKVMFEQ